LSCDAPPVRHFGNFDSLSGVARGSARAFRGEAAQARVLQSSLAELGIIGQRGQFQIGNDTA